MLQVLGRLHPVLVHFPIALLLAALAAELVRRRREGPSEAGYFCLALGSAGAVAAAASGWLFAAHDPPGVPELLLRHRWSGTGAAAAALVTCLSAWRWRRTARAELARPTRVGLALTALLVGLSGHLGGAMVYGEGFALEPLGQPEPLREPSSEATPAPEADPSASAPAALDEAPGATAEPVAEDAPVDFLADVRPILERRCFECHGDRKRPKGKLRLTDLGAVLARPPETALIVPGDAAASELVRRIALPRDDEDVMPPEDEEPMPSGEIELVRRWIAEGARGAPSSPGASPSGAPAEPEPPAAEAAAPRGPELSLTDAQRAARDAALARLRARGAHAQRLAASTEAVEVDLGVLRPPAGDAELALLSGLEPCLVELSLARSAVTDAGLAALARYGELRRLRLEHTALGDAALAHLAPLARLESLDLFATRVSDAGLAALHPLAALTRLYTGETALTAAALDELARARPAVSVVRGTLPDFAPPPAESR